MREPFEREVELRETEGPGAFVRLALWSPLFVLGALLAHSYGIAFAGTVVGAALLAWTFRGWKRNPRRVLLRADERGISIDGMLRVKRGHIKAAYVVPDGGLFRVYVQRWGPALSLPLETEADGRALLRAIGFDSTQTAMTVTGVTVRRRVSWAAAIPFFFIWSANATLRAWWPWLFGAYALVLVAIVIRRTFGGSVTVGADGVRIDGLLRKPRFLAFRDIARVSLSSKKWLGLELVLQSGEVVPLAFNARGRFAERDGLVTRIRQGLAALASLAEQGGNEGAEALVLPAGRVGGEWLRALRALSPGAGDYRQQSVSEEQLWRVVEDPAADGSARAGAAVVLAPRLDDEGRGRLRVAAEACAQPRVRVAMEAAAEAADDERLAGALDDLGRKG